MIELQNNPETAGDRPVFDDRGRDARASAAVGQSPGPGAAAPAAGLVARYRQDHRNPVNHFLHVGVGWPMAAAAVLTAPFRPFWALVLFLSAYAIMFFGHFVFERNLPTVLRHPSTPFVIAWSVVRGGMARLAPRPQPR